MKASRYSILKIFNKLYYKYIVAVKQSLVMFSDKFNENDEFIICASHNIKLH